MQEGIRILVCDDEPSIRGIVASVLSEEGYLVTSVENGEQALESFSRAPYPIVITDIYMGGMTGIDLLKKVKQINNDTQVIIMTSHSSLDTAIAALKAGAYDYLKKPFDDINMITMVAERAVRTMSFIRESKSVLEGQEE